MPCRDDRPAEDKQPKIDNLTQMLCALCADLELTQRNEYIQRVPGLKGWWVVHKQRDQERLEREQEEIRRVTLKKTALNKLTREERQALGLR